MRDYHRLTEGQRNQVYALKKAGLKQYAIAERPATPAKRSSCG